MDIGERLPRLQFGESSPFAGPAAAYWRSTDFAQISSRIEVGSKTSTPRALIELFENSFDYQEHCANRQKPKHPDVSGFSRLWLFDHNRLSLQDA